MFQAQGLLLALFLGFHHFVDHRGEDHFHRKAHLAAGYHQDAIGRDLHLQATMDVLRHRLAQRQDAVGRRVAVMAVAQRLDGGFDDMGRRLEVGLADAEVDDVLALPLQLPKT